MKEKNPRNVVIINDIDSENIEKAILILRSGGSASAQTYHIVTEAQELINAYRKTMEKNQGYLEKKEARIRKRKKQLETLSRALWAIGVLVSFIFGGYLFLYGLNFLLDKI